MEYSFSHKILSALKRNKNASVTLYSNEGKKDFSFHKIYNKVHNVISILQSHGIKSGDKVIVCRACPVSTLLVDIACIRLGIVTIHLQYEKLKDNKFLNEFIAEIGVRFSVIDDEISIKSIKNISLLEDNNAGFKFDDKACEIKNIQSATFKFTSGTTLQKALICNSSHIQSQVSKINKICLWSESDKLLLFSSLAVFLQRCYVYNAILNGVSLCLCKYHLLNYAIKNASPTIISGIPSFYRSIYKSYVGLQAANSDYSFERHVVSFLGEEIKVLLSGTAPLPLNIEEKFLTIGLPILNGYGMTETGLIAKNTIDEYKLGSVGKIFSDMDVNIAEDGEIFIKSSTIPSNSYIFSQGGGKLNFAGEKGVSSGDLGYISDDGYLFITGRKKDQIVMDNGTNISPLAIEKKFDGNLKVKFSLIFTRDFISLEGIFFVNDKEDSNVIEDIVSEYNMAVSRVERIERFYVVDFDLNKSDEFLTTTGKMRRERIVSSFANKEWQV